MGNCGSEKNESMYNHCRCGWRWEVQLLGILKECRNDLGFAMDFDKNIAEYSVDAVLKKVDMYIYKDCERSHCNG